MFVASRISSMSIQPFCCHELSPHRCGWQLFAPIVRPFACLSVCLTKQGTENGVGCFFQIIRTACRLCVRGRSPVPDERFIIDAVVVEHDRNQRIAALCESKDKASSLTPMSRRKPIK